MANKLYRLKISRDDSPQDPRDDDNLSKMICWHRRYKLGDEHKYVDVHDALMELIREDNPKFSGTLEAWVSENSCLPAGVFEKLYRDQVLAEFNRLYVDLPLFLYAHSVITMSTGPFGCPFDSGQVGFICMSKATAIREMGYPEFAAARTSGVWTEEMTKRIVKYLTNDVETYDQYLTGEVYGFQLESHKWEFEIPDADDGRLEWEEEGSCWGFFGTDIKANGLLEHLGAQRHEALAVSAMEDVGEWVTE